MEIKNLTLKKQGKKVLSQEEIFFAVNGFTSNAISKNDMAEFIKAIYKNSMTKKETFYLTKAMLESGSRIDLTDYKPTVDKHSTGGVSDSTTLIVTPLFALLGLNSLKMSGKALGHTGGTADKIKVFKGLNNELDVEQALKIVKNEGACFIVSSQKIAPADKLIYALRDEIGAVDSLPLIASSIMSKKLASGSENIVLDVKFGKGAFLKGKKEAKKLAKLMCFLGKSYFVNTTYVLGDMNQPLGSSVGNVMEVLEAIKCLKTGNNSPLLNHSKKLVLKISSKVLKQPKKQIAQKIDELIKSGKALEKLKNIVKAQGGSLELFDLSLNPDKTLLSKVNGKLKNIKIVELGLLDRHYSKEKSYKGIKLLKRLNDKVYANEPIAEIYYDKPQEIEEKLIDILEIK